MDEDFEADLVVVVVECQKRDSHTDRQTDSTIIYIDLFFLLFTRYCPSDQIQIKDMYIPRLFSCYMTSPQISSFLPYSVIWWWAHEKV